MRSALIAGIKPESIPDTINTPSAAIAVQNETSGGMRNTSSLIFLLIT